VLCCVSSCAEGEVTCEVLVPCAMGAGDEYRVDAAQEAAVLQLSEAPGPGVVDALVLADAFCVDRVDMDRVSNPHGEHASQVFTVALPPGLSLT